LVLEKRKEKIGLGLGLGLGLVVKDDRHRKKENKVIDW